MQYINNALAFGIVLLIIALALATLGGFVPVVGTGVAAFGAVLIPVAWIVIAVGALIEIVRLVRGVL